MTVFLAKERKQYLVRGDNTIQIYRQVLDNIEAEHNEGTWVGALSIQESKGIEVI